MRSAPGVMRFASTSIQMALPLESPTLTLVAASSSSQQDIVILSAYTLSNVRLPAAVTRSAAREWRLAMIEG
ncbi:MAG: hypothetical protein KatS3mg059_0459 [Thermomicrobiales bacterium]|nr:MAG: hypothetical protein KatS3mg059_0459 [Thermomicrobiales bacterium]